METIERQRRHFDSIAGEYLESRENSRTDYFVRKMWNALLKNIPWPADREVIFLDAMCGNGDTLDVLEDLGYANVNYNAFDYSPQMAAVAKARRPRGRVWEQDITTFCQPNAYDVICITGGLHHVREFAPKVLGNIYSSLKPGGFFLSCEPTHGNALFGAIRNFIYSRNAFFDHESERGFSLKEWKALIDGSNLVAERQIYPGMFSYVVVMLPFLSHNKSKLLKNSGGVIDCCFRKWIDLESCLWGWPGARFFSFATSGCYRKPEAAAGG